MNNYVNVPCDLNHQEKKRKTKLFKVFQKESGNSSGRVCFKLRRKTNLYINESLTKKKPKTT